MARERLKTTKQIKAQIERLRNAARGTSRRSQVEQLASTYERNAHRANYWESSSRGGHSSYDGYFDRKFFGHDENTPLTRQQRSGKSDATYAQEDARREGYGRRAKSQKAAADYKRRMADYDKQVAERTAKVSQMNQQGYKAYDIHEAEIDAGDWVYNSYTRSYIARDMNDLKRQLRQDGIRNVYDGWSHIATEDLRERDSKDIGGRELKNDDLGKISKPILSPKDSTWKTPTKSNLNRQFENNAGIAAKSGSIH